MEKFLALAPEKQNIIVDAAMSLFGTVGYKKASVADIAAASGLSKSMVFYYFGSKKALYLYLIETATKLIKGILDERFDSSVTDFFGKLRMLTEIKMSALRQYPSIFTFLTTMYYETDEEVARDIKRLISEGVSLASTLVIGNSDTQNLKDDVDPELVLEILTNYVEGYMSKVSFSSETDTELLLKKFYRCLDLMERHFSKND